MSRNISRREELKVPVCFFNYLNGVYSNAQTGEKDANECYKHMADMFMSVIGPNFDPSLEVNESFDDPMALEYAYMACELINLINQ